MLPLQNGNLARSSTTSWPSSASWLPRSSTLPARGRARERASAVKRASEESNYTAEEREWRRSSKRTESGQPLPPPPPPPRPNLPSECPEPLASTEAIAYPHGHHTAGSKPSNFSKPEMSPGTTPHFQGVTGSMEIPLYFCRCDVGVRGAGGGPWGRGRERTLPYGDQLTMIGIFSSDPAGR